MQQISFHSIWCLIFGHVVDTCSIFPSPPSTQAVMGKGTQETTLDAVSYVTSVFVQNAVIYSSVHQHSAVTEFLADLE